MPWRLTLRRPEPFADNRPVSETPCEHGYSEAAGCPRCSVPFTMPPRRVATDTRWHATQTTLAPRFKVVITAALIVPALLCLLGLSQAGHRPIATLLVLPLLALLGFSVALLPAVWQPGRRP